ncbi:hypothetical protein IM697_01660 [Streptomyces ferrugineus]|uniref:Uncharacterized protein n=1 Tax=Streptomyces ferrugineus TaxID=1413221 RepID=A0A7M2SMH4_9ACTN|nr:DUF6233 domain-containing protein [Streptomyces ferrugineus]QOV37199.1 hypothetical protein IM697_01660 [Streptomyces ferrugineus]
MAELPPDARRLRAILANLDEQIASHETVGIYLRLQREAVRAALTRAENRHAPRLPKSPQPRQAPAALSPFAPSREMRQSTGFVVQQKRTPNGPEPAVIRTGDCTMIEGTPHRIGDHDARAALTDPNIEPCAFCRPDSELGILD